MQPPVTTNNKVFNAAKKWHDLGVPVLPFKIWFDKKTKLHKKQNLGTWKKWETQPQTDEEFNSLEWEKANGYGILLNGKKAKNGLYVGVIDYDPKAKPNETEEEKQQRLEAIERAKKFLKELRVTQIEETANKGLHYIYWSKKPVTLCTKAQEYLVTELLGKIKLCLMAPSFQYRTINDNTPTEIEDLEQYFLNLAEKHGVKLEKTEPQQKISDKKLVSFDIAKIVDLTKLRKKSEGKYQGSHPIHDSTTENNFSVDTKKNTWYCHRHHTGGGSLLWLAVQEGLLDCEKAKKGVLKGVLFKRARQVAIDKNLISDETLNQISDAKKLLDLIYSYNPYFFKDQYKDTFVLIKDEETQKTLNIYESEFEQICRDLFYTNYDKIIKKEHIKDALATFEALSRKNEIKKLTTRVANRSTENGLEIWIDLCNRKQESIKITKNGYTIEKETPPLFRRYEHMKQLSYPKKDSNDSNDTLLSTLFPYPPTFFKIEGGEGDKRIKSTSLPSVLSLNHFPQLFNFLRIPEEDRLLIIAAIISYFFLGVPYVIIYIHGESGKGKSFGSKAVQCIIDPSTTEILGLPKKAEELLQEIDHRFFVSYDNVGFISDTYSDIFCRVSTGAGISKRKLYTDNSDFYRVIKRPLWFNGISVEITREDMLKRTILSEALPLDGEAKAERIILAEIEKLAPYIQHDLYTLIAKVIEILPTVKPSKLFRMADYTQIGCAVTEALGYDQELFIKTYEKKLTEQTRELIWNNVVGNVLYDYIFSKSTRTWKETPTKLFKHIKDHAKEEMGIATNSKGFPKNGAVLSKKINLLIEPFKKIGVNLEYCKGVIREWQITNTNKEKTIEEKFNDCETGSEKIELIRNWILTNKKDEKISENSLNKIVAKSGLKHVIERLKKQGLLFDLPNIIGFLGVSK